MDAEQIERIGELADRLDAVLYAAKLPLPADIHLQGLQATIREVRDEIVEIVREVSGEDPWATNPLEG